MSRYCSHSYCTTRTAHPSGRCAGHPLAPPAEEGIERRAPAETLTRADLDRNYADAIPAHTAPDEPADAPTGDEGAQDLAPCASCGGSYSPLNVKGCLACCRDCGFPCTVAKDNEGFHADEWDADLDGRDGDFGGEA